MRLTIIAILFFLSSSLIAQNVIGLSTVEVKSYFKSHYPDMVLEGNIKNEHYSYLKYSDPGTNLVTALVFLNSKGGCTSVRFIYDLCLEEELIEELNNKYEKIDSENWRDENKKVKIIYKKEDWFITVNYKEE